MIWTPPLICGPSALRTPHVIDPSSQPRSEKNNNTPFGCGQKRVKKITVPLLSTYPTEEDALGGANGLNSRVGRYPL